LESEGDRLNAFVLFNDSHLPRHAVVYNGFSLSSSEGDSMSEEEYRIKEEIRRAKEEIKDEIIALGIYITIYFFVMLMMVLVVLAWE
jgi:hypothetical protein